MLAGGQGIQPACGESTTMLNVHTGSLVVHARHEVGDLGDEVAGGNDGGRGGNGGGGGGGGGDGGGSSHSSFVHTG